MGRAGKLQRASLRIWTSAALLLTPIGVVAQEQLTAPEMRSLFSGNTLSGTTEHGREVDVYQGIDGKMSGQLDGEHYDVGRWDITDDGKFCRQWTNWRDGKRDCFRVYRVGEGRIRIRAIGKDYSGTYRILEGDPHILKVRM